MSEAEQLKETLRLMAKSKVQNLKAMLDQMAGDRGLEQPLTAGQYHALIEEEGDWQLTLYEYQESETAAQMEEKREAIEYAAGLYRLAESVYALGVTPARPKPPTKKKPKKKAGCA